MSSQQRPTNAELAILRVLWRRGASTVREVHGALPDGRDVGYTTVLKLLQIMVEKGLVARDVSERSHVFMARVSEAVTERRLVSDLLERVFEGSALRLVQQALSAKRVSRAEMREIRQLLDDWNGGSS